MMTAVGGNVNGNNGNGINKWLLFGLGGGLGLAGGIGLGYTLGKKNGAVEAKEAFKKARHKAYMEGFDEGFEEASAQAQAWIDENIVCVAGDTPEEIAENTAKLMKEKEEKEAEKNADKDHLEENNSKGSEETVHDQPSKSIATSFKTMTKEIEDFSQDLKNRVEELFLDGMSRADISRILKIPESSVRELTKDLIATTNEDIENYDLSIDDESDSEEVEEMKEARERYLDHIDKYLGDPTEGPHYISAQDFNEATMLDQIFINYYEGDNTFVDIGDTNKLVDPVTDFGTADGKELFANAENREEPDTIHMCNMKMNAVYEITRYEQSYESIRDGSAFLNGNTVSGG